MATLAEITRQSLTDISAELAQYDRKGATQLCLLADAGKVIRLQDLDSVYGGLPAYGELALANYYLSFLMLFFQKKRAVATDEIKAHPELEEVLRELAAIFTKSDPAYKNLAQKDDWTVFLNHWLQNTTPFSAARAKDNPILDLLIHHDLHRGGHLSGRVLSDIRYLVHSLAIADEQLSPEEEDLLDFLARETAKVQEAIGDDLGFDPESYGERIDDAQRQKLLSEAMAELDELVGLEPVKHEVRRLASFLKIRQLRQENDLKVADVTLHFVFKGNPGTGKTTVARILGKIFKGLGFLDKGEVIETDRSALVAEYMGQTAVKTRGVAQQALDSILFIDEAYALSRNATGGGSDNYGREAIETLLKFMEDNRRRLVVVVAGYPRLMDQFIDTNPGLGSRFTRYLEFTDFSPQELCRILQLFSKKNQYRLHRQAAGAVHQILAAAYERRDEGFGNARFVRNLFEETVQNQAMRLSSMATEPTRQQLMTLEGDDLPETIGELFFARSPDHDLAPWCVPCPDSPGCPMLLFDHDTMVHGRTIGDWSTACKEFADILACRPVVWNNPQKLPTTEAFPILKKQGFDRQQLDDAAARLARFQPLIAAIFPETAAANGTIESPLRDISTMRDLLSGDYKEKFTGKILLKCDNELPIAGSVKARGGGYEVLKFAERVAKKAGLLNRNDAYTSLASQEAKTLFSGHRLRVGSTGNLGLAIGLFGVRLGFQVEVHMSADASAWKKKMLRDNGAEVIEHKGDYSEAVASGRRRGADDPACHFIDDEQSLDLFWGYGVAACYLRQQLEELDVTIDNDHPLIVHLPCGVGGAPSGIGYGLKTIFGDNVRCYFAEPTGAPAMLVGLATGLGDTATVGDFGIRLRTDADGLAVGRPSPLACRVMRNLVDGIYTVADDSLFRHLATLYDQEGIALEPSAAAGLAGLRRLATHQATPSAGTHLIWATGGGLIPQEQWQEFYRRGKQI